MRESFVLMTALPPTTGHLDLIKFARALGGTVSVIVCTQPGEPYVEERFKALLEATRPLTRVIVYHFHQTIQQEPDPDNPEPFWKMWKRNLQEYGFREGDYLVSSESYGKEMAEAIGGVFMPYDLNRTTNSAKATWIREDPIGYQHFILPEFMKYLRRTVTIFGAESVGKTTVTNILGTWLNGLKVTEWARPYLETVGPEVTIERMASIYVGQSALQHVAEQSDKSIYVIQDTDLFSTLGYWEMWDPESVPDSLRNDAHTYRSDLYVILSSDIPFETDPLRYGLTSRETKDQYWIDLCEREHLRYVYITETQGRANAARLAIEKFFWNNPLEYTRSGLEYEKDV